MKTVKISELPTSQSREGLYTLGTDGNNQSVKVPLDSMAMLNGDTGRLNYSDAPATVLASMGQELDNVGNDSNYQYVYQPSVGEFYFNPLTNRIYYMKSVDLQIDLGEPVMDIVYTNRHTELCYRWNGNNTGWKQVGGDKGAVKSVTMNGTTYNPVNGVIDLGTINQQQENVAPVDNMEDEGANTVFAPASSRAVQELYINVKALFENLANIAFFGNKPVWQEVARAKYSLTKTLNACDATVITGDANNGKIYEGQVVIRLTPSTSGWTFSNISVAVGENQVAFAQTDNQDGSIDISFVCTGDTALSATAISGHSISVIGNHISYSQSHVGNRYTVTLQAHRHFSLPDSVTVKNGDTLLISGVDYNYSKEQGTVVINNVTNNNISITVNVDEDAHALVSLASGVTNVIGRHEGDLVEFPLKVYADMLEDDEYEIVFSPADGCKFTIMPSTSGNQLYENTLTVVDSQVTHGDTIEVLASARPLNNYLVTLPSDANIITDDGNGDPVPDHVQEDGSLIIHLSSSGNLYLIDEESIEVTMDGIDITSSVYDASNGIISIDNVTGVVVVQASAITYENTGLVFHLDCKNRGGQSNKWIDLIGGKEFSLTNVNASDNGMVFNGSSSKAVCNSSLAVGFNEGTIEFIIEPKTLTNGDIVLFNGYDGGIGAGFWDYKNQKGVALVFALAAPSSHKYISCNSAAAANSMSQARALIDGNVSTPATPASGTPVYWILTQGVTTNKMYIGCRQGSDSSWKYNAVTVKAIRVYNTQLTEAQARHNYEIDKKRFNIT